MVVRKQTQERNPGGRCKNKVEFYLKKKIQSGKQSTKGQTEGRGKHRPEVQKHDQDQHRQAKNRTLES